LATHADFQPGELSKSYIQLYNQKIGLNELRELGLNKPTVDLLVISACRSAYGDKDAELGFAGLAVQAGVKSAIASLWYVGDTGTLALMSDFYRQLETAPIKAEALRLAQVDMIEGRLKKQGDEIISTRGAVPLPEEATTAQEDLTHPFYWAAFTMIGSPW
jgi:CHAT domain-containing protein